MLQFFIQRAQTCKIDNIIIQYPNTCKSRTRSIMERGKKSPVSVANIKKNYWRCNGLGVDRSYLNVAVCWTTAARKPGLGELPDASEDDDEVLPDSGDGGQRVGLTRRCPDSSARRERLTVPQRILPRQTSRRRAPLGADWIKIPMNLTKVATKLIVLLHNTATYRFLWQSNLSFYSRGQPSPRSNSRETRKTVRRVVKKQ